jgi:gamma-glutamyltranspeptidase/glutathione hydrolase
MKFEAVFQSRRSNVTSTRGMVATSQPLAALAGLDILKAGGNAADAAVAAASTLCVVQPIQTGIGGDCFALYWDAGRKQVTALNGSGRAPAAASIDELRTLGYEHMPVFTGHAVSVPGTVAGWNDLLDRHGSMKLADALSSAIWYAENGYPVSEIIGTAWAKPVEKLLRLPSWESGDLDNGPEQPSGNELLVDGRAPRPGELMRIPTLAETLRGIAADGKDYIYRGVFAEKLCQHVQLYGGWITPEDMSAHTSTWETPITAEYRDVTLYECPPNGQGLAAAIAVNLASGFDLAEMNDVDRCHIMIECMRLGFADAMQWVADPEVVKIPVDELLSKPYTDERRRLISMEAASEKVDCGLPLYNGDTVYVSAVDGDGNACSFINSTFALMGTGLVVPGTGVALQNRASLFVLDENHPNALAPNKRPYHTIIPAMTTRQGELHASYGIIGDYMQPQGHLQLLVNMVDLEMSPQMSLDVPRWRLGAPDAGLGSTDPGGYVRVESSWNMSLLAELAARGHRLVPVDGLSRGVFGTGQIIVRDPNSGILMGGSEPRSDGCAVGW